VPLAEIFKIQIGEFFNRMGGLRPFAAFARALGPSGESSPSKRDQIHECCKRSNGREEPIVPNAALHMNVWFSRGCQKCAKIKLSFARLQTH
jgi:hypothetical protein